jgi:hypothetical protein
LLPRPGIAARKHPVTASIKKNYDAADTACVMPDMTKLLPFLSKQGRKSSLGSVNTVKTLTSPTGMKFALYSKRVENVFCS